MTNFRLSLIIILIICLSRTTISQENKITEHEQLINAAREIIEVSKYCALITLDDTGHPQSRMMQAFPPEDNMIIWFGTNPKSRKVEHLKNDPRTTVFYSDPSGDGYVSLTGISYLIDDPSEKQKRWMPEWDAFYPDREESYLLIKFIPEKMEVVSYRFGLTGDSVTWAAPIIQMNRN